ncbi:MAG: hypothetical protein Salg2KO_10650 [Salibacteraceae bacterium]
MLCLALTLLFGLGLNSQVINGYARVSSIVGDSVFSVVNVNETGDSFEDGDAVIVMQMQDSVIGANTGNNASFGGLSSIQSAGLYEVRYISSHVESAGVPTSITLTTPTTNTYNVGVNSSVQLITFPSFGSPDYTTTGNLSALDWDGNVGGVLAFEVSGVLTLAHNLTASGDGFRGGSRSANYYSGGTGCAATGNFIRTSNHTRAAEKGEGIYRTSNNDYLYAKGKLINGGGGGAERINAGGGGGGNYSSGGNGGYGWSCNTAPGGGGVGGVGLSANISSNRIFMGGGGGGGQQNNSASTDGSDGGGIIIIRADEINTTGTCAGRTITSDGLNVPTGTNDGQGGGGAGGSIVFQVNSWNIVGTCPLTISANGGDGGSVNSSTHAGGGGGGQGVIVYSSAQPVTNVTTNVNNGTGGCNNNSNPCTNQASAGQGVSGTGIIPSSSGPLPVDLIQFNASSTNEGIVELKWQTASETNCDRFLIERSIDTRIWHLIAEVNGNGNSTVLSHYSSTDYSPINGESFYRLKQVDFDGDTAFLAIGSVQIDNSEIGSLFVYPNPTHNIITIGGHGVDFSSLKVYNLVGADLTDLIRFVAQDESFEVSIDLSQLAPGVYFITSNKASARVSKR